MTADDGTEAYYAHGRADRATGRVQAGDVIGYVSDSGNARGTPYHLHFAAGRINSQGGGTIRPSDFLSTLPSCDPNCEPPHPPPTPPPPESICPPNCVWPAEGGNLSLLVGLAMLGAAAVLTVKGGAH